MKRVLIVILAITTLASGRDKKLKGQPGPYIFFSKAPAQTLKALIVQANLNEGYVLDADDHLQFSFSKPAQMPIVSALFVASSACTGMTTKKVWSYTLTELHGITKVTVQPVWEYPDDYCKRQTQELIWGQKDEIAVFQAMLDKAPTSNTQAPTPPTPTSSADQQQSMTQRAACLELAKDNPSVTCK
ncbi:MAG: hypothetical protein WAM79_07425 [Candidatus Sulfotelmatobacter sp.]